MTTTSTHDAETQTIFSAVNAFQSVMASGQMSEIQRLGEHFAMFLGSPSCLAPNVQVALLEELRAEWTRLYRAEVEASKTSISGVLTNEVGGFMVVREDREAVAQANREKLAARHEAPRQNLEIPQGTFTVEHTDGSYETVKIKTHLEGTMAGKTIASFLSGPDNESSFTGFAFIDPSGRIKVWSRFANIDRRWIEAVEIVLSGDNGAAREAYAIRSGKCSICGRKLTVPASLHQGMGPECFSKWGGE